MNFDLYHQLTRVIPHHESMRVEEQVVSDPEWDEPPAACRAFASQRSTPEDDRIAEYYSSGSIEQDLSMNLEDMEARHDYIQYMFPLMEASAHNPHSPILSMRQVEEFRKNDVFLQKMKSAWAKMLTFYGLARNEKEVIKSDQFERRNPVWLRPENHNFLRVTRMIKSLRIMGLEQEAAATFLAFKQIYQSYPSVIGFSTFNYWQSAIGGQPALIDK